MPNKMMKLPDEYMADKMMTPPDVNDLWNRLADIEYISKSRVLFRKNKLTIYGSVKSIDAVRVTMQYYICTCINFERGRIFDIRKSKTQKDFEDDLYYNCLLLVDAFISERAWSLHREEYMPYSKARKVYLREKELLKKQYVEPLIAPLKGDKERLEIVYPRCMKKEEDTSFDNFWSDYEF